MALAASINVADRPMTGQGVMGMRAQGVSGRLVEDTSYYVGLVRKKINDVSHETNRLRQEIDQQTKDSSQIAQLEKKYETLLKNKEALEGQLADYNLALDKVGHIMRGFLGEPRGISSYLFFRCSTHSLDHPPLDPNFDRRRGRANARDAHGREESQHLSRTRPRVYAEKTARKRHEQC